MAKETPSVAIVLLTLPPGGSSEIFFRDLAGIPLFLRLALTLQRAGVDELVVISHDLPPSDRHRLEQSVRNDPRWNRTLCWVDRDAFLNQQEVWQKVHSRIAGQAYLLVRNGLVATPKQVREFSHNARTSRLSNENTLRRLAPSADPAGGLLWVPPGKEDFLDRWVRGDFLEEPVESVRLENPGIVRVVDRPEAARQAERELLKQHKSHYTQLMDIWFNSRVSLPISRFLVKTPLTPNQVTLLGLLIGLAAGWCFSWGTYAGGLIGGGLLVLTAIWDCCDGDVARLKFMESDFGETLDTLCDNVINVFLFTGLMIGVSRTQGLSQALIPFFLLTLGGLAIFSLIYFQQGSKGSLYKGTRMYPVIQILASRNFIYVILLFAVFGKLHWFLWASGIGSVMFAVALSLARRRLGLVNPPPSGR